MFLFVAYPHLSTNNVFDAQIPIKQDSPILVKVPITYLVFKYILKARHNAAFSRVDSPLRSLMRSTASVSLPIIPANCSWVRPCSMRNSSSLNGYKVIAHPLSDRGRGFVRG